MMRITSIFETRVEIFCGGTDLQASGGNQLCFFMYSFSNLVVLFLQKSACREEVMARFQETHEGLASIGR